MNSESLQKCFSEVYRDFFANNDIIASWCYTIPWGYEGWFHRSESVNFRSKIPLKCYVGAKKTKTQGISFKNISFFDVVKSDFDTCSYDKVIKEELKIKEFLEKFLHDASFGFGVEISILSETTRWHGFWFSGTHLALLSSIILLLISDKDNLEEIDKEKIFRLSWKLDFISRYGNSIWEASAHALSENEGPSYIFSEKFNKNTPIEDIDGLYSEYQIISEKFKNTIVTEDSFLDIFMIFSGTPTDTKFIEQSKIAEKNESIKYENFIKNEILDKNPQNISFSKFWTENSIYPHLLESLSVLNFKSIFYIKKLLETWNGDHEIEDLIEHINNLRYLIWIIEKQSPFAEDFSFFFRKNMKNFREKMWIMPVYSWKSGGWCMVVVKTGISRDTVEKTIQELKTIYPQVVIEYCSYIDGKCKDGVKIEQYISKWVYSKYIDKNKFLFQSNKGERYIGNYHEILEQEKEGLLFDMIHNKMYLNGEKLTSKDIPSQNTTIEIIIKLLENKGEEISNKDLPNSSYSGNKNEMLGKIVMPFLKFIEEKTNEQLCLVCKGSINDFYLKMEDVNLRIWTIQRI